MVKERKSGKKKHKVGLNGDDERRLRNKLRGNPNNLGWNSESCAACSEPWVDAQFRSDDDVDANGVEISYRYHVPTIFPPRDANKPANTSKMLPCCVCGRNSPPQNVATINKAIEIRVFGRWQLVRAGQLVCQDCGCDAESDTLRDMRDAGLFPDRGHGSVKTSIRLAKHMASATPVSGSRRTKEMMEDTRETKFGIDC